MLWWALIGRRCASIGTWWALIGSMVGFKWKLHGTVELFVFLLLQVTLELELKWSRELFSCQG